MGRLVKRVLGDTALYAHWKSLGHRFDYSWWLLRGRPSRTPHLVKQHAVLEFGRRFGLRLMVETGTYYGEMVAAVANRFDRIYTIELDPELARLARNRFRNYKQVEVLEGDSGEMLVKLLPRIQQPCLFWLDAGYYGWDGQMGKTDRLSGELAAALTHPIKEHVILMDDVHGLNGQNGAPTIDEVTTRIKREFPDRHVEVANDILRVYP